MDGFYGNINDITDQNNYFRRVIGTTNNMQLVVMSIITDIGMEVHPYTTQFIRVEQGNGIAIVDDITYELNVGDAIMIPPNSYHNIINKSNKEPLKLYTLYSPPNHKRDRLDITKPFSDPDY
jgi:mannose-6-phosphate isomerase-like protein (cupin superfamily)